MSIKVTKEKVISIGYKEVDSSAMSEEDRELFLRRKKAIDMRLDGYTGREIREQTGISESELTRIFKRYTVILVEGVYLGEAGLVPYSRTSSNVRRKELPHKHTEAQGGLSGALSYTLGKYPKIAEKFVPEVFRKDFRFGHGSRYDKKHLCALFCNICKTEGVRADEWPLNQPRGASRTIRKYINEILESDFERAALATGGKLALTHSRAGTGRPPLFDNYDVFDLIEIDSYHVDAFFVLNITGDRRIKTNDVISRIWIIAAVCRRSNAVLAMKFVFSSEIRAQDLVDLICDAYTGCWTPRQQLHVSGLKYSDSAGMPGYSIPALKNHTWGAVCLDNAMQHHANQVYELALHAVGFGINFGPLKQPARRSKVEALFKRIASRVMHQIESTTGSSPESGRAESPEKAAIYYQIDVDDALEVMDVYTANYNSIPQGGLNKANSPLEVLLAYCNDRQTLLTTSSEAYLNSIALGSSTRTARVTGNMEKGIRPRIKLDQAIYTSPDLANSAGLIDTALTIRITPSDYRTVEAYLPSGIFFGVLTVEAAWRKIAHSVTTRRLVNRALYKREFEILEGENPLLAWRRHMRAHSSPANNRELQRLSVECRGQDTEAPINDSAENGESQKPTVSERWKNLDILK
ncbi:hypothetical protein [Pseudomonas deceptionensis]|uniref:Integrase catalytic domain-containing protein n=1 Tax=Pseudomonas deceptionensis TaxID=882211 RepID=A0A0J6G8N0_PSEDM|nr:hypothetical protein [Pseudomonas deceptionensis]KMM77960.1 hypothetical protein TR67_20760 [Pseudomonas deceptionensis]SEE97541.1 hypothetical protein SAMN04489800_3250 [Pseudomonas deceptionensis]